MKDIERQEKGKNIQKGKIPYKMQDRVQFNVISRTEKKKNIQKYIKYMNQKNTLYIEILYKIYIDQGYINRPMDYSAKTVLAILIDIVTYLYEEFYIKIIFTPIILNQKTN